MSCQRSSGNPTFLTVCIGSTAPHICLEKTEPMKICTQALSRYVERAVIWVSTC